MQAAQPFHGTRVTRNEVVESRAWIWMATYLVPMVATVRICAVIEKPFESSRIHRLAWRKDDGEMSVPQGVHIGAVRHEKLHHRDAIVVERGSHEGSVAPLVHVRSVGDHPFRHGQSHRTRRLPRHAAFGNPRERPILTVAEWGTVQRRVARHHGLDALDVVGVDCLLELPDLLEGLDVSLELGPTRKPVETRDLELRIGE